MADAIILTTAHINRATVWTQDNDFKGINSVMIFEKQDAVIRNLEIIGEDAGKFLM